MFANCQEWRATVEGVGIDELYKQIDPFDVGASALAYMLTRKDRSPFPHSIRSVKRFSTAGLYGKFRSHSSIVD
jgi:hypothetical protein